MILFPNQEAMLVGMALGAIAGASLMFAPVG